MPDYTRTLEVNATPEQIFAVLADIPRTPEWLERCTRIDVLSPGEPAVGAKLKYHYRDGRRTGTMDGVVAGYVPGRRLAMLFTDLLMDVSTTFAADPLDGGRAKLRHSIHIRPKGAGKILTPLISRQLPRQTDRSMERLKELVERRS
jgi:hypothetical protein